MSIEKNTYSIIGKLKCKQNAAGLGYWFPIRFGRHKLWHLINWHSVIVRHFQFIVCAITTPPLVTPTIRFPLQDAALFLAGSVCVCVCVRHATIVCAVEHEKKTNSQNAKSTPNSNSDFAIHSSPAPLPLTCCCCYCCCCCCCVVASVVELRCTAAFKMVCQSFFHIIDCLLDYKPRHWLARSLAPFHFLYVILFRSWHVCGTP